MTDRVLEFQGWVLAYRRPDLEEVCYAGPFPTEEEANQYADKLPPDRYDKNVGYGTLKLTPKTDRPSFRSLGPSYEIPGRGWGVGVENPGGYPEPNVLAGQEVLLDGQLVTIKAIETFSIARPYPEGLSFGFLLDHPMPPNPGT